MRDDRNMRTTLDLDNDVLQAAKEIAAARGTTAGKVVSDLVRKALEPVASSRIRNGVPLMPRQAREHRK
jgi:Arc/MetJ family transcription regulator